MSGTVEGSDNKQLRVRDFSARGIRSDFTLSTNADTWRLRLHGRVDAALPLQSLLAPLGEQLAAQQLTGGTLTVDATARGDDAGPLDFTTAVQLQSVNIEGVNVLQDVSGSVSLNATRDGGRWQLDIAASLQGGALYIEPGVMVRDIRPGFFVDLGQGAIDAAAKFQRIDGGIELNKLQFEQTGVIEAEFAGAFNMSRSDQRNLSGTLNLPDLAAAYATYFQPVLIGTTLDGLEMSGRLMFDFDMDARGVREMLATVDNVYLDDKLQRFALYGVHGTVALTDDGVPVASELRWEGASLFRLDLAEGVVGFRSAARELVVDHWRDLGVLDGVFRISEFSMAELGSPDFRLRMAGELEGVSLESLTHAMNWPIMQGDVNGHIPALTYQHNSLDMQGDLAIDVFGGAVTVSGFHVDEVFSNVPEMRASAELRGIDLAQLTRTMSFGNIKGTMDGYIRDLYMVAWEPVAFDARFATRPDDDVRHRISRQAVDNLGRLGAGASSAMSSGWLSLIPSYSYGDLGISCRLRNGYCELGGVREADDGGFYLLTRGGILPPWIDVRGNGRIVPWTTLVDGLRQITSSEAQVSIGR